MVNPFAYEEYRKDKIRQKIEETRAQRVQLKVKCSSLEALETGSSVSLRLRVGEARHPCLCVSFLSLLVFLV